MVVGQRLCERMSRQTDALLVAQAFKLSPPRRLKRPPPAHRYGINTWLGGAAIHQMLQTVTSGALGGSGVVPALGITVAQTWCFLGFNALQVRAAAGRLLWGVLAGVCP